MYKIKLVYIKGAEIGTRKMQSYPLGIMEMRAYAYSFNKIKENVNIDIDILDYDVQDEAYIFDVYQEKCDMILFSTYIWNLSRVLELGRKIRIINESIIIGLGGPEVDDPIKLMMENTYINIISVGEGEKSFVGLIEKYLFMNKTDLAGVVYREKNGKIVDTGNAELLERLDDIPSIVTEELVTQSDMLLYETSRGCPFQCKYCCWAGKRMRYYSLERVEKDIKFLLEMKSGSSVFIIDSELDIDLARAKKIMNIIAKYNIHNKLIQGFLGLHTIDTELMNLCKRANFKFGIGIQSVNDEAILQCGRTWFDVKKFEKKLHTISEFYNIKEIEFQLIMGLPGDNYETFRKNLQWCNRIGAVNVTANRLYVLPGSYFYKNAEKYELKFDKEPYHLVYSNYSYSYEEMMRSEALLVAFQITKSLFGTYNSLKSDNNILDMWDYIDSLVEVIANKQMYSQGRQESQVIEREYEYENILIDNLENMNCYKKEFVDYFHMKITQKRANNFFKKDEAFINGKEYIKLNAYFIAPYLQMNKDGEILNFGEYKIVYLHNFKTNCIKKVKIKNEYADEIEGLLKELTIGVGVSKLSFYNDKLYLASFVQCIIEENLCYYTNERGKL